MVVHFQPKNPMAEGSVAEEVFVEVGDGVITAGQVDGKHAYMALLSELVPLAIGQLSPKKGTYQTPLSYLCLIPHHSASSTRILRPGITVPESLIQVGSVGKFMSGDKPRHLDIEMVNQYPLRPGNAGLLVCDLFLEEQSSEVKVCLFIAT